MDISALLGTVLSSDSVENVAKAAGVSGDEAKNILGAALPSLLNGALAQSENSETAEGFAGALTQHAAADTGDLASFLKSADVSDGSKIVAHLLGDRNTAVTDEVSRKAGTSADSTASVMAAAAPLLMSLLGQQTGSSQQSNSSAGVAALMGALLKNADMSAILSGLLGAGSAEKEEEKPKEEEKKPGGLLGALTSLLK